MKDDRDKHFVALNANGDPARFAPYGLPVVPDLTKQIGVEFMSSQVRPIQLTVAGARQYMAKH